MPRFEKTRIHPATAVLFMLGLYALGGLAYAAWVHSADAVTTWMVVAIAAFVAAVAWHRFDVARRRRRSRLEGTAPR